MDKKSLAAVIVDKRRMEMREFAVPDPGADDAVLKVEACGICGSDYHYYKELDHWPYLKPPHIMGHEVVGRIGAIGRDASRQWNLKEGDLVAVEAPVTCQRCRYCLTGNATLCADKRSYGISASMADPPHLWGGYAQYMYLHPNSILHPVPAGVTPQAAVLYTCVSNGLKWAQRVPALSPGDSIVILGPGQQGLGCVLAAAIAGAATIVVAGLEADAARLAVAKELGATHLILFRAWAAGRAGKKYSRVRDGGCRRRRHRQCVGPASNRRSGSSRRHNRTSRPHAQSNCAVRNGQSCQPWHRHDRRARP